MKLLLKSVAQGMLAILALVAPLVANEPNATSDFVAHEWGTFTTLHQWHGSGLSWYQTNGGKVSELPAFVQGNRASKMYTVTARMETPVIYFYTNERRVVDVSVDYPGGRITEFYPGTGPEGDSNQWKQLQLIPAGEAGELVAQLPVDPKLPDNHYYQARAVPEAALVQQLSTTPQTERFVFYRGAGSFDSGLRTRLEDGGQLKVTHNNHDFAIEHAWALQSSAESIRWQKLPALPSFDPKADPRHTVEIQLGALADHQSRIESVSLFKESMITALTDSGLTGAEAAAMIATWDEQWYEEPGQRVFSIVPQGIIDDVLPLTITPTPTETVRVFVHRAEVLSPETTRNLEEAMDEGTDPKLAASLIAKAKLGRFVHGAIEAVATDVGFRTTQMYRIRGFAALEKSKTLAATP